MRLRYLLFTLLFVFTVSPLLAQNQKVTGIIKDESNLPIEFVNVILQADGSDKVSTALSQADGSFEINVAKSKYKLTVSFLGYDTYTSDVEVNGSNLDLGTIVLKANVQQLGEAVVTAKLIDRKADRFVMNIAGNSVAAGKNSIELLSMAPSVWVDKRTGISINGKLNIKVMVNDRVMSMSTDELQNYLETIPSEDIQSIEIITDPGAEYEANSDSGIIHIKLKKGRLGTFTGSVTSGLQLWLGLPSRRDNPSFSQSFNLSYRKNKLSLYGSGYFNTSKRENDYSGRTEFFGQNRVVDMMGENVSTSKYLRGNIGAVYELTDKHEVGFTFETRNNMDYEGIAENTSILYSNDVQEKKTVSTNTNKWDSNRYDASLNYKYKIDTIGSSLKVFLDYTGHHMNDSYLWEGFFNDSPTADSTYNSYQPADYNIYAARVDYLKKFNEKTSISLGGRYGYAAMGYKSRHNDLVGGVWVNNPIYTDDYSYTENIVALYAKLDSKWKNLLYTVGLRYEFTGLNVAHEYKLSYDDLFPSIYLKYNLNDKKGHSVNASYNRKLSRPYYTNLNPFKTWTDEYSYYVGNPYLKPTYSNAFSVGATLFDKLVLTAQYTVYTDATRSVKLAAPEENVSMGIMQNIDKVKSFYASAYLPVKLAEWYSFTAQVSAAKSAYESDIMPDQNWVYRGNTQHTFKLPLSWTVSISGWFSTKSTFGNSEFGSMGGIDGSISKRMFDNKLVASFNWWNIQGFRHGNAVSKTQDYQRNERFLYQNQVFGFTLTYNFSRGKKADIKKVETGIDEDRL